jgi:hypothetical protein
MMTISKLEAFCRMAEANQAGVEADILTPDHEYTLVGADMAALAAEIRELQRRAEIVSAPGVDIDRAHDVGRPSFTGTFTMPSASSNAIPDADGWIEWKGGKCPVADSAVVDVRLGDGRHFLKWKADYLRWTHFHCMTDIVAYRIPRSA